MPKAMSMTSGLGFGRFTNGGESVRWSMSVRVCSHLVSRASGPHYCLAQYSSFVLHLPQQLWKRRRLCKAGFILLFSLFGNEVLKYNRWGPSNEIEHKAMHTSNDDSNWSLLLLEA